MLNRVYLTMDNHKQTKTQMKNVFFTIAFVALLAACTPAKTTEVADTTQVAVDTTVVTVADTVTTEGGDSSTGIKK